ncbi:hypothetical protein SBD_4285 [Streptomyces bottropensis ATCC 25435]|uniref:Uncharacterized protein n=1 Tax=Streptomyces bottropensis ATCC 25435 TaxID=1054862 RepID=M3DDP2_9ACTN|nr:hypothetical protein SBD_4285 [Streptomyces bottropensis ATCC 25435]
MGGPLLLRGLLRGFCVSCRAGCAVRAEPCGLCRAVRAVVRWGVKIFRPPQFVMRIVKAG